MRYSCKQLLKVFVASILFASFTVGSAKAQELVWDGNFDFFFDNREYKSAINWPQSLFGARISPEIGVTWNNGLNSIMIGADLLADFGTKKFEKNNDFLLYFQHKSKNSFAALGVIPRRKMIGDYPAAFFSDSVRYYDPNIDGVLLQKLYKRGYIEFGCDWNSQLSKEKREKFMLFSAAQMNRGLFSFGYHFYMYHHAGTTEDDGVVDNVWVHPYANIDLTKKTRLDSLTFRVGWIQTFQNDRKYVGKYVTPGGVQLEARVEKWKFGVYYTFYRGKNLMPYYMADPSLDYGSGLYWGEPFYRTSTNYQRLEIYWNPIKSQGCDLKVSSVHHFDGHKWGWQQKIIFSATLGRNNFKKK